MKTYYNLRTSYSNRDYPVSLHLSLFSCHTVATLAFSLLECSFSRRSHGPFLHFIQIFSCYLLNAAFLMI